VTFYVTGIFSTKKTTPYCKKLFTSKANIAILQLRMQKILQPKLHQKLQKLAKIYCDR